MQNQLHLCQHARILNSGPPKQAEIPVRGYPRRAIETSEMKSAATVIDNCQLHIYTYTLEHSDTDYLGSFTIL